MTPYPPLGELDSVIRTAIGEQPSLDAVLHAVRTYAERTPRGPDTFYRPRPGLSTDPSASPDSRRLQQEEEGTWFHMLLYNAGNACFRANDLHLALEVYKQALLGFDHPAVYNNIAAVLVQLRRPTEARMWLERGAARDPKYPQTFLNLASLTLSHQLEGVAPAIWLEKYAAAEGGSGMLQDFLQALPEAEQEPFRDLIRTVIPDLLPVS